MYRIEVARQARKALAQLPPRDQARVEAAIDRLSQDPRPAGCMPVRTAERGTYRVRVDGYRVLYVVLDAEEVIIIVRISRRGEDTDKGL